MSENTESSNNTGEKAERYDPKKAMKKYKKEQFEIDAEKRYKEASEQANKSPYEIAREVAEKMGKKDPRELRDIAEGVLRRRHRMQYESGRRRL